MLTMNKLNRRAISCCAMLAVTSLLNGGCATSGQICTKPPVAAEELQLDKQLSKEIIDDHIYFSKEASSGGRSFGGGGCGCN